jgi:hypothetical protein
MMGVFGMLGVALMVFVLRETVHDALWARLEKHVRCGFWGLNIGLAMMILFSLFPSGVLQVRDVLENGYWHARSLDYLGGSLPRCVRVRASQPPQLRGKRYLRRRCRVTCGVAGSDQGLVAFCRDTPGSRAKQKEIRTKSLRFHNSKREK